METQAKKTIHPLVAIASIAVILFSGLGVAALMGWLPASTGKPEDPVAMSKADKQPQAPAKSTAAKPKDGVTTATRSHPVQVASNAPAAMKCIECGVIESVREIEKEGKATGLGAVGGAVVGGVVGNQMGGGRGKDVMTVVGAVGGGIAGHQIEKKVNTTKSYQITVRFEDGATKVFNEPHLPSWKAGDKVKVIDGQIRPNA